jgi:hypothetical protein
VRSWTRFPHFETSQTRPPNRPVSRPIASKAPAISGVGQHGRFVAGEEGGVAAARVRGPVDDHAADVDAQPIT